MAKLVFTEIAWEEYLYWQTQDKKTLKKINRLLKTISRTPFSGEGKPEPLKYENREIWSRRINQFDRLVYIVNGESIEIIQCKSLILRRSSERRFSQANDQTLASPLAAH